MAAALHFPRSRVTTFAVLGLVFGLAAGQPVPAVSDSGEPESGAALWTETQARIFNGQIHTIYIKINQASWNQLHDDEKDSRCEKSDRVKWVHARYFVFDDIPMKNVAIKVRGNTSRCIPRLQFSVSFDRTHGVYSRQFGERWHEVQYDDATRTAIKDRTLAGLSELSLRRSFNDSSSMNDSGNGMLAREAVATWAAAEAEKVTPTTVRGPPVYRTAYALVEFQLCASDADNACNNRFRRAYLVAEPIDKGFFRMRYDDRNPTVFAMSHGCALKGDRGFTLSCVEPEYLDGKKFDQGDPDQQAKALGYLTGPGGLKARLDAAGTPAAVAEVLDLDSVMNYAAVATTVGHWDSAYGNFNNDLLYFHAPSGKWKLITWDMDNTFDYDGPGGPQRSYSYLDVAKASRILFDKLFAFPELDARVQDRIGAYLSTIYDGQGKGPIGDKIRDVRDRYIARTNAWLVSGERQNRALAREMLDYTETRYAVLRRQLQRQ